MNDEPGVLGLGPEQNERKCMIALIRDVSPRLDSCELTHQTRTPIDVALAQEQHRSFASVLEELGVQVERLDALVEHSDGVFVEDAAVVLPEVAVLTRPGAASRQAEVESVAQALVRYRPVERILAPGTLDGGDVLLIGRTLFVGVSGRTNREGLTALTRVVSPFGYGVKPVEVRDCLHLKTAATFIPPHFIVINPAWVDAAIWADLTVVPVDEREPFAANTLTLSHTTLVSGTAPETARRLQKLGLRTRAIDISELQKAEAGLTCLALLFEEES